MSCAAFGRVVVEATAGEGTDARTRAQAQALKRVLVALDPGEPGGLGLDPALRVPLAGALAGYASDLHAMLGGNDTDYVTRAAPHVPPWESGGTHHLAVLARTLKEVLREVSRDPGAYVVPRTAETRTAAQRLAAVPAGAGEHALTVPPAENARALGFLDGIADAVVDGLDEDEERSALLRAQAVDMTRTWLRTRGVDGTTRRKLLADVEEHALGGVREATRRDRDVDDGPRRPVRPSPPYVPIRSSIESAEHMHHVKWYRAAAAAGAVGLSVLLVACGGSGGADAKAGSGGSLTVARVVELAREVGEDGAETCPLPYDVGAAAKAAKLGGTIEPAPPASNTADTPVTAEDGSERPEEGTAWAVNPGALVSCSYRTGGDALEIHTIGGEKQGVVSVMAPVIQRASGMSASELAPYVTAASGKQPGEPVATGSGNVVTVRLDSGGKGDVALVLTVGDSGKTSLERGQVLELARALASQAK
ncbi:hypothetical protein [Streptomyces sp. NPDC004291]